MGTSLSDLKRWFEEGKAERHAYLIVVCDSFDHEDYPLYADTLPQFWELYDSHDGTNMQRIMEVYDLSRRWTNGPSLKMELPPRPPRSPPTPRP